MTDSSERNNTVPESTERRPAAPGNSSAKGASTAEERYLSAAMKAFSSAETPTTSIGGLGGPHSHSQFFEDMGDDTKPNNQEGTQICELHEEPLNFWSKKLNKYQCIRCLVNENDVHYIDKSYKGTLEKFRNIQSYAMRALLENAHMEHLIKDWKDDIRDILGRIHSMFIEMITEYTRKFYRSLLHIEMSDKMKQFYGEDSRQRQRLDQMRERYIEIADLISQVDQTPPNLKAAAVRSREEKMEKLNSEMLTRDKEMKRVNWQLHQAMTRTVDLEPLSQRIFGKYLKYIDEKVKAQIKQPLTPKSYKFTNRLISKMSTLDEQIQAADEQEEDSKVRMQNDDQNHPEMTGMGTNIEQNSQSNPAKNNLSLSQGSNQRKHKSDLLQQQSSKLERYQSISKTTVHFMMPDSQDMYIMDFNSGGKFVKEQIEGMRFPLKFSTKQTPDGKVFIVGGYRLNQGKIEPLRSCYCLNESLQAVEMDSLQSPRFDIPLALVHDRFLLAIGGKTNNSQAGKTRRCEAYDTVANHWFHIDSLPASVVDTNAVVMNGREVYLMPGNCRDRQQSAGLTICRLDTGPFSQFPRGGDHKAENYGYAIMQYQWQKLEVRHSEFIQAAPTAAVAIASTELLVFGGSSTKCFKVDTSRVNEGQLGVETTKVQLMNEPPINAHFSSTIGPNYFAMNLDSCFLYHLDINSLTWGCKRLRELGVTDLISNGQAQ